MEKIKKTGNQVAEQMERWFLRYIPTGKPWFAGWNVTRKFEIIGRRYAA